MHVIIHYMTYLWGALTRHKLHMVFNVKVPWDDSWFLLERKVDNEWSTCANLQGEGVLSTHHPIITHNTTQCTLLSHAYKNQQECWKYNTTHFLSQTYCDHPTQQQASLTFVGWGIEWWVSITVLLNSISRSPWWYVLAGSPRLKCIELTPFSRKLLK